MSRLFLAYAAFLLLLSPVTFCMYGIDKQKAKKGAWRTPERTLLLFSLFGGALGGFVAMQVFRHKTRHWYFTAVNLLGILLHTALLILCYQYT